ncbi:hypothetical protein DBR32_12000 [Taibaiella sp. KBW10]|uniref:hypothetical protein n=1 Tax=Taibaiella sp. KBW10 TaxID=2153357 RepID=UPI000F5B4D87|nr:hypothetical protein [Taibaiella sp. KBW10]RQO30290.1 hypothetical protein DBR32_12000 [Taibaiella sp. KBW10]
MQKNEVNKQQMLIIKEIAVALSKLGANSDIISIVASWKDTLSDEDVLNYLKDWNSKFDLNVNKVDAG